MRCRIPILFSILIALGLYFSMNCKVIGKIANNSINDSDNRIDLTKHEMLYVYTRFWGVTALTTSETKKQYLDLKTLAFNHLEQINSGCSQEEYNKILVELFRKTKLEWNGESFDAKSICDIFPLDSLICKQYYNKSKQGHGINLDLPRTSSVFLKEAEKDHFYWDDPEVSLFGNKNIESEFTLRTSTYFAICKYWNVINYFYPYKNAINIWNNILWMYLNKADSVVTKRDYYLLMARLTSEINDLHAFYAIHPIDTIFGEFQIGLNVEYVHPDFIITTILDSSKFKFLPVKIGDKIIEINNVPVNQYADSLVQYISGSRLEIKYAELQRYLLFGKLGSPLLIKTNRDTFSITCTMKRFSREYMKHSPIASPFLNLSDSIVYINYGAVKSRHKMKKYFSLASDSNRDILIDMTQVYRGNTHPAFSKFMFQNSCTYAQVKYPDENTLGNLKIEDLKFTRKGKALEVNNLSERKQKIYVLINEKTRSHGEYVSQILIHCLGGIPIGRPTAGCDGDIRFIKLPYDFWTGISGIGIFGPNMEQYQINGIQPQKYIPAQTEEFTGDYTDFLKRVVNNYIYKND